MRPGETEAASRACRRVTSLSLVGGREGTGGLRCGFPVKNILTTEGYTRIRQVKREAVVVLKTEPDFWCQICSHMASPVRETGISHQRMKSTECAKASLLVIALWGDRLDPQSLQSQNQPMAWGTGKTNRAKRWQDCNWGHCGLECHPRREGAFHWLLVYLGSVGDRNQCLSCCASVRCLYL